MVAGEQKLLLIQKCHAAGRMARHRNDLKLRHDLYAIGLLNDPFRIRSRADIRPMDYPFRPEMRGVLLRIRHIVFMCEEDVRDAALLFEGRDEMFEITRRIDEPVAVRMLDEETI